MGELVEGIYERLRTAALEAEIAQSRLNPSYAAIDKADVPSLVAGHLERELRRTIEQEPESTRVDLINSVLALLDGADAVRDPLELLHALVRSPLPGEGALPRPDTPLSSTALLTNATDEPTLGAELRSEIASADQVDLLCAFIKWHGLRVIEAQLLDLADRGIPVRVITSTYLGGTERRAVDALAKRFGAQVRISYETQSTRLHAKAWLFRRNSGYHTAFVGSSNLSKSALVDGLEWNVRLSSVATGDLIRKITAVFESYWSGEAFAAYDPDSDGERLASALAAAGAKPADGAPINISGLEVRPYPHQQQILEALRTEREVHDRHRNLVVAATGTGKTVVAALDYRGLAGGWHRRPSLLFVAHRKEILEQSLRTYREVLADGSFGELLGGGQRPSRWRQVFANIQSLSSEALDRIPPDRFDVVVVDEFHHAEAATYRRLLDHVRPKELLGLTATPERGDGVDVRSFFENRTAFELRLWDALAADLLVPFHYFGIADGVDLQGLEWRRGDYDGAALDRIYTGNDARARLVLRQVRDKVTDVHSMRALGYCVSIAHAEYMARVFNTDGIRALAVSGKTPLHDRKAALDDLKAGRVNVLFAADLFNEGLDVPSIDTVLFLRPTQSATIFLQQLGRGLRRSPDKAVLTALDFIGHHRREFRFDTRYRALTGASRTALMRHIEHGFPYLPSGSQLVLDRVSQQLVLDSVKQQLQVNRTQLAAELRSYGEVSLEQFLAESGRDLADVYRSKGSWTDLRRRAGLPTPSGGPDEPLLLRRLVGLLHVDDPERARLYARLMSADAPAYDDLTPREQTLARMLFFTLWPDKGGFGSYQQGFEHLRRHPAVCEESRGVIELGADSTRHAAQSLGEGLFEVPLLSHARYRREEILAGLGWASWDRVPAGHPSGVAWAERTATSALLVNLRKSEADFSPTTMYKDYAISLDLFHWESPNTTRVASAQGRRFLNHREAGAHIVLFVRNTPTGELGAEPFLCLGPATYVEHRGERPIAITWRLHRPMPGDTFHAASLAS